MHLDPYQSRFEAVLERVCTNYPGDLEISGTSSELALSLLLTQATSPHFSRRPQLVVVAHPQEAVSFSKNLRFFDPQLDPVILPPFDVSPYSGLYPNHLLISERMRFLWRAQRAGPGEIFVTSIEALLEKTLPPKVLADKTLQFQVGDEVPTNLAEILTGLGFQSSPVVEDAGQFSWRGGLVDVFSPAHTWPVRIELFGDTIESARFFDPETQRSRQEAQQFTVIPPRELFFDDEGRERVASQFRKDLKAREADDDGEQILHSIVHGQLFPGVDFLLPYFYDNLASPLEHFKTPLNIWFLDKIEVDRTSDILWEKLTQGHKESTHLPICPEPHELFFQASEIKPPAESTQFHLSRVRILDSAEEDPRHIEYSVKDLVSHHREIAEEHNLIEKAVSQLRTFKSENYQVFISAHTEAQTQRLQSLVEKAGFRAQIVSPEAAHWHAWIDEQQAHPQIVHIVPRGSTESIRVPEEQLVFMRDEDFFGRKIHRREYKSSGSLQARTHTLSFGDLTVGDHIVHVQHGVGIYDGLKVMQIQGVDAEFIQLRYKDDDRLYLPIYRVGQIQKYSGAGAARVLDKLGGTSWQKATVKVKNQLRDIANELLTLYAKRSQTSRSPFHQPDSEYEKFEAFFPYDETEDQLKAVQDVVADMVHEKPMDRLVCGDVGFGKTEIAMRAAFLAVESRKQVAVLAPTTVLTYQHLETFQKRFKNWPVEIRALNRFVSKTEMAKTLQELRAGKVDVVIGTHRLLSKDVSFGNLGLLIIDEEQRFGVTHKEKIRKAKMDVDTLTLSATPIPRTLNMSLTGLRDLSIINTPPSDRLPTRTFVCKFDEETIRKAVEAEVSRGGQIFFIHNRIQSIYALADELRSFLPGVRMQVAHGQMEEGELEKTMVKFFHHEIDMLVCTTIVESGMDIPRANTMFIDDAHTLGLSQLYQLRGRVGRSKERAYCYLLVPADKPIDPVAQERLKVIQENTALGSGIRIAQYDLELRGAGNLLGEDQSGHINAVGYELYMELLEESLKEVKGEPLKQDIEPEINVRIPALIPSDYIQDIRIRLSYYKALSQIEVAGDLDRIEEELRDQFGKPPEPVLNLMGLMLIRRYCKDLGVRDLSSGVKTISLAFTPQTSLAPEKVVQLTLQDNKKFSITPDSRLIVRMNQITWPNIYEELVFLKKLAQ